MFTNEKEIVAFLRAEHDTNTFTWVRPQSGFQVFHDKGVVNGELDGCGGATFFETQIHFEPTFAVAHIVCHSVSGTFPSLPSIQDEVHLDTLLQCPDTREVIIPWTELGPDCVFNAESEHQNWAQDRVHRSESVLSLRMREFSSR